MIRKLKKSTALFRRILFSLPTKKIVLFVFVLLLIFLPLFSVFNSNVYLNQFSLQTTFISHGSFLEMLSFFKSAYPFGWNLMFDFSSNPSFNVSEPSETLVYLFDNMPYHAYVYPTETYYYYKFSYDETIYAGNFRLLDANEGKLHIAYYDESQPHGGFFYKVLNQSDDLIIKAIDDFTFKIIYKGRQKIFHLTEIASQKPKRLQLLPEEEFVAHIIDESGIFLFLIYNDKTSSFYYILDEERPVMDSFSSINSFYILGKRTKFIFYNDDEYDRKLLVGVSQDNIYQNDYYDGPFDQVPPRLPLKEKLEAAYPYTKYAGGIDEHGNFKGFQQGSRVAISPYLDYKEIDSLLSYHSRCNIEEEKSIYWSCLTYEWKKDFHKTLEEQSYYQNTTEVNRGHVIYLSQGWPGNHEGSLSIKWPGNHTSTISSSWKPNHITINSLNKI